LSNNLIVYLCNVGALTNNDKNGSSSFVCVCGSGKGDNNNDIMNGFKVANI
jgi:hypothetical protein